jgi:hypothetical protein
VFAEIDLGGKSDGLVGAAVMWMPWDRRGDFQRLWRQLRGVAAAPGRASWRRVKRRTLPYFEAVVDAFFAREWLHFRCVVARDAPTDQLVSLLEQEVPRLPGRARVRAARRVASSVASARRVRPRVTPGLQLARLLLRAVLVAHGEAPRSPARRRLLERIARHLGLEELGGAQPPPTPRFGISWGIDPALA